LVDIIKDAYAADTDDKKRTVKPKLKPYADGSDAEKKKIFDIVDDYKKDSKDTKGLATIA